MLTKINESNEDKTRSDINVNKLIESLKNKTMSFSVIEDLKYHKKLSSKDYHRILFETGEDIRFMCRYPADHLNAVLSYSTEKRGEGQDVK